MGLGLATRARCGCLAHTALPSAHPFTVVANHTSRTMSASVASSEGTPLKGSLSQASTFACRAFFPYMSAIVGCRPCHSPSSGRSLPSLSGTGLCSWPPFLERCRSQDLPGRDLCIQRSFTVGETQQPGLKGINQCRSDGAFGLLPLPLRPRLGDNQLRLTALYSMVGKTCRCVQPLD